MMLSSLLDVIDKLIRKKKPLGNVASIDGAVIEFLREIAYAEKFDFGTIVTEQTTERQFTSGASLPMFKMPDITDEEMQFWFDGLLPLPADVCWYEFRVTNKKNYDSVSGLLIKKDKNGIAWAQRIEYNHKGATDYMCDGTWVSLKDRRNLIWKNADDLRSRQLKMLSIEQQYDLFGSSAMLMLYFTLMINSKTTEVRRVAPTAKQQSLRKQLRKTPLPAHTIVTIVPQRFIDEARKADGEKGTHASPRIHWRRSHLRTINKGLHNEKKLVIARQIVGRRELGEVKHDYVVRMQT